MPSAAEYMRRVKERVREVDPKEVRDALANGNGSAPRGRSTCASSTSSRSPTSPAPCTCRAATWSPASRAPPPTAPSTVDPLLRVRQPLGARRAHAAGGARLRERRVDERRHHAVEGPRLRRRGPPHASPPSSARATRATCCCPRSGSRASSSCSTPRCCCSAPAGSARRPRSTWPPPASGTLGIVDDDEVDVSNLQRQVIHTTDRVGEPKVDSAEAVDPRDQPRRRGREVQRRASTPRTSWRSSRATT